MFIAYGVSYVTGNEGYGWITFGAGLLLSVVIKGVLKRLQIVEVTEEEENEEDEDI